MPTVTFNVKLLHAPGLGGINRPLRNASVQIVDIDAPGKTNDVIWEGTTNNDGVISGTSVNWQDQVKRPFPLHGHMPDPFDIAMFVIRAKLGSASWEGPLPVAPNNAQLPVVTTIPAPLLLGKVNGREYDTLEAVAMSNDIHDRVDAGSNINIEIYGPLAVLFAPLALPYNELKTWVRSRLPHAANPASRFGNSPGEVFWILVGVSLIIGVSGATAVAILIGLAVIYAIYSNYNNIAMTYEVKNIGGIPVPALTVSMSKN